MNPRQFIYFDLGNVLVHFSHQRMVEQVADLVAQPPEIVWQLLFEEGLQLNYERGAIDSVTFHHRFREYLGVQVKMNDLLDVMSDIFWLNEPVVSLVQQLRGEGTRLGVLSNTCSAHWNFVCERFALLQDEFETAVLSYQEQSLKPEPLIFRRAIERAGVTPEQILFIDDREENVRGARQLGIDAICYESPQLLAKAIRQRGFQVDE